MMHDLRHAVRVNWKSPRHTLVIVATLALGIAASTAILSLTNAVLLKPLPYPDAGRIVALGNRSRSGVQLAVSAPRFIVWRNATTLFEQAAAYGVRGSMNLRRGTDAEQVIVGRASVNFFRLFGASLTAGRGFTEREDRPAGGFVVMIGDALWRNRFGADPAVVGTTVTLNDVPYTIIGVLSADFDPRSATPFVAAAPDLWIPLQLDAQNQSDANNLLVAARLRPHATLQQGQADTDRATAAFRQTFPGVMPPSVSLAIMPLREMVTGGVRDALTVLLASVAFLLVLVIANIACLLLARTAARRGEWAVRVAAGATRGRLVRQALLENIVLAIPGGVLGIVGGVVGIRALLTIQPGNIPRIAQGGADVAVDWRVLLFAAATSAISAIAFGTAPALLASHADPPQQLKTVGARSGSTRDRRIRALLVISEVAVASILLVGAALLARSFVSVRAEDPGFDAHDVVTIRMVATGERSAVTPEFTRLLENATAALVRQPGVMSVGATLTGAPLEGDNSLLKIAVVGRNADTSMVGSWRVVTPGYFSVFSIPLIRGRLFQDADAATNEPVVIINRSLADRFWRGRDPLNDRLLLGEGAGPDFTDVPRRIIGVVGDTRQAGLDQAPIPAAFVPIAQLPNAETAFFNRLNVPTTWFVRVADRSGSIRARLRDELRKITGAAVTPPATMEDVTARSIAQRKFEMVLMASFALTALLVSALGLYGVCAYSVQQRAHEIGVRLSLGARVRHVRTMVLREGIALAAAGTMIGLIVASGAANALRGLLYGVTTHDATVFVTVPLFVLVIAMVAVWIPANRAARIDLTAALRSE